ncbi:hypothetical protein U1Q18_000026 [Sarracenia purpurea var. burkii]
MGSRGRRRERWCVQPLTPLMEGLDLDMQDEGSKKESSWEVIREWFRAQKNSPGGGSNGFSMSLYGSSNIQGKRQDLRLLLGVLGCPLAPIPLPINIPVPHHPPNIRDIPIESSRAQYIIQQYLAATGCLRQQQEQGEQGRDVKKNMYATGVVKMICCETEVWSGKGVKSLGKRSGESGCFVLWQMTPGMWSLELVLGTAHKLIAGSDGNIVWRYTPCLGTHAAKGPHRPLRRLIQGLDPKSTARVFGEAQWLGEKRIGDDDCFVLKVRADGSAPTVMERNEGVVAEVIRHVVYGYFSQKSGLLIYMEDSHLTRIIQPKACTQAEETEIVYWETTIGSKMGEYREVDGVLIAHEGRSIATMFRFGEDEEKYLSMPLNRIMSRTRMEEVWRLDDVVFNVPGLSIHSFIPPADITTTTLLHSNPF